MPRINFLNYVRICNRLETKRNRFKFHIIPDDFFKRRAFETRSRNVLHTLTVQVFRGFRIGKRY